MNTIYIWSVIFFCIGYLIVTDQSIARLFTLLIKIVEVKYHKVKWWLFNNPENLIVKWLMWRRSLRLAKELEEELKR